MEKPQLPVNETKRLKSLESLDVLDSLPEERFDRLTRIAQQLFEVDIALVSLVDENRQWFKSKQGLDACQTPRDISFCGHAVLNKAVFVIPDASKDKRFADNPLVTGPPNIRFYAGAPLAAPDGNLVGTFCIIHSQSKSLTAKQIDALKDLAACAETELSKVQLRAQRDELSFAKRQALIINDVQGELIRSQLAIPTYQKLIEHLISLTHSPAVFFSQVELADENLNLGIRVASNHVMPTGVLHNQPATLALASSSQSSSERAVLSEVLWQTVKTEKPVFGEKTFIDIDWLSSEDKPFFKSLITLPILRGETVVAILGLADRANGYSEETISLLEPLLASISQLISVVQSQQQSKVHQQRLADIIEGTNIGTWEWNVQTGETRYNERWAEILGYRLQELQPTSVQTRVERVHPDDLAESERLLKKHFNSETSFYDLQTRMQHKDGHWVWVHDRGRVISWTDDGQPEWMFGSHADISEQKSRELERRESSQLLENVLNAASQVAIISTDTTGVITLFNKGAESMLGYSQGELKGKETPAIFHQREEVQQRGEELSKELGRTVQGFDVFIAVPNLKGAEIREWNYIHKDGRHLKVSLAVTPMFDANGGINGYLGVAKDITDEYLSKAELKRSQKELQRFFDLTISLVCILDHDGYLKKVNKTMLETLGYEEAELASRPMTSYVHPDDIGKTLKIVKQLNEGQPVVNFSNRFLNKNGQSISLLWNCMPDKESKLMYASAVDITQQLVSEKLIEEQAARTKTIIDNVIEGILTVDKSGVILSLNPAAVNIFGYPEIELIGKQIGFILVSQTFATQLPENTLPEELDLLSMIGKTRDMVALFQRVDPIPVELSVSKISQHDEERYVCLIRDISERKLNDKMKGEFISTVNHELRTPLTSISGALSILSSGALGEFTEKSHQMLNIARTNCERLAFLINDLLDMEKLIAGKVEFDYQEYNLVNLIETSIEENVTYGVDKNIQIKFINRAEAPKVSVDQYRFKQVMANLLSNAIKYSPKDGVVKVTLSIENQQSRICVSDKGPGIPQEFKAKIFEKFSQADSSDSRASGGTGLGLAITKELVEKMKGTISFNSKDGEGAQFYVVFPTC